MDQESLEFKFSMVKQYVEFLNIALQYPYDANLTCNYRFVDYKSQEGDRIAIYKLGWTSVKDYVVFEWAPINKLMENTVVFDKYSLPKNINEMYQMCYISSENQMYGISAPFQFCDSRSASLSSLNCLDLVADSAKSMQDSDYSSFNLGKDVMHLKMENKMLRHSLQDIMEHLLSMQKILMIQQKEINLLKEKCFSVNSKQLQNTNDGLCYLKSVSASLESDFDVGELEAIPPFPFAK